jgi:predicted Zn-dependent protease
MRAHPRLVVAGIILLITLASYYGMRQDNPVTGETQHVSLSTDQEVALGLNSAPQMEAEMGGADPDPKAQALMESVGRKIVESTAAKETPYKFQFRVLRDPNTVNAFALPGGPIYITRGLLNRMQNEAQLAGVLGHEIGHVVGRHAAEHIAKSQLAQGLVGAVGVAASDQYGRGQQAAMMAAFVAQMMQLRYGRSDELESDRLGVRFMTEAGYDPRAMMEVMKVLESASKGAGGRPEFLSTHPNPGNRQQHIQETIVKLFPNGLPSGLTRGRVLNRG